MRITTSLLAIVIVAALVGCSSLVFHREKTVMDAAKLMAQGKADAGIQILEKLAKKGDDHAMLQLGIYYYGGEVVKQDYPKAMDWFLQALTNQNVDAFVNLGVMHRNGNGVPVNKKIAYCVFLTTYMCELGSEATQYRASSCLQRIIKELSIDDIRDCLSNYTLGYVFAYLEAKGEMTGIPDEYKPSKEYPALKDMDWWLDGELEAIYGEPVAEEKAAGEERQELQVLKHTLVFEIRIPKSEQPPLRKFELITDGGLSSGPISQDKFQERDGYLVFEGEELIFTDAFRYLAVETSSGANFIFKINHPSKAVPCDWGAWQKPDYAIRDSHDKFILLQGGTPSSKMNKLPPASPEIRFKVEM